MICEKNNRRPRRRPEADWLFRGPLRLRKGRVPSGLVRDSSPTRRSRPESDCLPGESRQAEDARKEASLEERLAAWKPPGYTREGRAFRRWERCDHLHARPVDPPRFPGSRDEGWWAGPEWGTGWAFVRMVRAFYQWVTLVGMLGLPGWAQPGGDEMYRLGAMVQGALSRVVKKLEEVLLAYLMVAVHREARHLGETGGPEALDRGWWMAVEDGYPLWALDPEAYAYRGQDELPDHALAPLAAELSGEAAGTGSWVPCPICQPEAAIRRLRWLESVFEPPGVPKGEWAWHSAYGGKPWAYICRVLRWRIEARLGRGEEPWTDPVVWIDHVLDIQHNSGTVLDKGWLALSEWADPPREISWELTEELEGVVQVMPITLLRKLQDRKRAQPPEEWFEPGLRSMLRRVRRAAATEWRYIVAADEHLVGAGRRP